MPSSLDSERRKGRRGEPTPNLCQSATQAKYRTNEQTPNRIFEAWTPSRRVKQTEQTLVGNVQPVPAPGKETLGTSNPIQSKKKKKEKERKKERKRKKKKEKRKKKKEKGRKRRKKGRKEKERKKKKETRNKQEERKNKKEGRKDWGRLLTRVTPGKLSGRP